MEPTFLKDDESVKLYKKVIHLFAKGDQIKALEIIEDMILVHKEDKNSWFLNLEQGNMFIDLAEKSENLYVDFTYMFGSVGCFSRYVMLSRPCAHGLYYLAEVLGSVLYFKKCVNVAKQGLSVTYPDDTESLAQVTLRNLKEDMKKDLESLIEDAKLNIDTFKNGGLQGSLDKDCEVKVLESKKNPELLKNEVKGLRSYWSGLDVKVKREFMQLSIAKLISFVEGVHSRKGRDALEEVLASARKDRKWIFWMCRTKCSKKFSNAEDCKKHLEQEHGADFKPSSEKDMVKRIGKDWARKISAGGWEPVDTVAAVEMLKTRLSDVKAFEYKNGWSKEWPLAPDEVRSKLLKEIKLILVMFCDRKILPCTIRDWVMQYSISHLRKFELSEHSLVEAQLVETPQSICFLECHGLCHILNFLKRIKYKRADGTDLVGRAVNSILGSTSVKEKIDFDLQFSLLLLDRRLLKSNNAPFDGEGTINVYYAKAHAQGDDIISWLTDYSSVDKTFPRPIREHNLDIWVAVLRAVQFTCRTIEIKYAKKMQVFDYGIALLVIENFCLTEGERRRNLQEDQWNSYASLLCDKCEGVPRNCLDSKLFVCTVRDVLDGALDLTFDVPNFEGCLNFIRERKSLSDDMVLLIDSKILLVDNSRISLLNDLTRLSVFDNRRYILQLLKPFLLNEIVNMESKARSDAVEADLLLEEEKKSQLRKKKNTTKKRKSTSMSSPLSNIVECKSSVNLELKSSSPSLKTVEADSIETDDTLASERGRLENLSSIVNQEEVMQNMPGKDSQSEYLESAQGEAPIRYNSALDMTLKALLNVKILKEDMKQCQENLERQVPSALKKLFTAFVSEEIKTEGVYSCLLSDLLASLEQVISMSSDAAEVFVAILEFWHCWKYPERESLVTRLFTLEVNERMSCRKCRKKPYYPEQSSYGIVMPADSIRDLKCALGNIEFVDILKVIRME